MHLPARALHLLGDLIGDTVDRGVDSTVRFRLPENPTHIWVCISFEPNRDPNRISGLVQFFSFPFHNIKKRFSEKEERPCKL